MNIEEQTLSNLKHFMVYNTINSLDNKKYYNKMDELLIRRRFYNAKELSYFENVFRIDLLIITEKERTNHKKRIVRSFLAETVRFELTCPLGQTHFEQL